MKKLLAFGGIALLSSYLVFEEGLVNKVKGNDYDCIKWCNHRIEEEKRVIFGNAIENNKSYISIYKKLKKGNIKGAKKELRKNIMNSGNYLNLGKKQLDELYDFDMILKIENQIEESKKILR